MERKTRGIEQDYKVEKSRNEKYLVSHAPECIILPLKFSSPGIFGQEISFSCPRAVTSTFALSLMVSPVTRFWTVIFLIFVIRLDTYTLPIFSSFLSSLVNQGAEGEITAE